MHHIKLKINRNYPREAASQFYFDSPATAYKLQPTLIFPFLWEKVRPCFQTWLWGYCVRPNFPQSWYIAFLCIPLLQALFWSYHTSTFSLFLCCSLFSYFTFSINDFFQLKFSRWSWNLKEAIRGRASADFNMSYSDSDSSSYGSEYKYFKQISRDSEFPLHSILISEIEIPNNCFICDPFAVLNYIEFMIDFVLLSDKIYGNFGAAMLLWGSHFIYWVHDQLVLISWNGWNFLSNCVAVGFSFYKMKRFANNFTSKN